MIPMIREADASATRLREGRTPPGDLSPVAVLHRSLHAHRHPAAEGHHH
ncbi:MAG: hypothetical protein HY713_11420 [candidate division NC10 bacterium]|nr:hypothetical protein [candidate division NC10 bacterium]